MINIEYVKYVNHVLGIYHSGIRKVLGKFKEKGRKKVIKEELDILNCGDDVGKSYNATLSYFNHTRHGDEKERIFVSAKWSESDK